MTGIRSAGFRVPSSWRDRPPVLEQSRTLLLLGISLLSFFVSLLTRSRTDRQLQRLLVYWERATRRSSVERTVNVIHNLIQNNPPGGQTRMPWFATPRLAMNRSFFFRAGTSTSEAGRSAGCVWWIRGPWIRPRRSPRLGKQSPEVLALALALRLECTPSLLM